MTFEKKKITKLNTPLGRFKWPKLTEPDYGSTDFPKPDGEYSLKLVFDESDPKFQAFRDKMETYLRPVVANAEAEFAALKKPQRDKLGGVKVNDIFTPIYDEDDEPTGEVEMKLSMKAGGTVKKGARAGKTWSRKPGLFDALGRPIKGKVDIWGGTEGIIAFSFVDDGYFIPGTGAAGIKCQLEAAQIVTLCSGGERSASDYGFGAQEGGFDASQAAAAEAEEEGSDDDDGYGGGHTPPADPKGAAGF